MMNNFEKHFSKDNFKKVVEDGIKDHKEETSEDYQKELDTINGRLMEDRRYGDSYVYPERFSQYDQSENNEYREYGAMAREKITPVVEKAIEDGKIDFSFGHHGHLDYEDKIFWGHYVRPSENGVVVTVYLKENIKGDPMDADGDRGPRFEIEIPLDKEHYKKMTEDHLKRAKKIEDSDHQWDEQYVDHVDQMERFFNDRFKDED